MAFTQPTKKPWKKEVVEVVGLFKKSRYVFEANERGPGSTIGDFIIDGSPAPVSLKCSHEIGNPIEGTRYRVNGYWSSYKSKSRWAKNKETTQFVAEVLERDSVMEFESFSAYLCAIIKEDEIPYIGMGRVSRIWKTFGKTALQKIRECHVDEFNRHNQGMHIDANAWEMLKRGVTRRQATESSMSEILRLIAGFGFPKSVAKEAHEKWGASAGTKILRNAFCLMTAEIQGAGFKRCDELYRSLGEGLPEDQQHRRMKRLKRLMLRIWYEIKGGVQGNVWTEEKQLRSVVKDSIEAEFADFGIPRDKDVTRLLDRAIALGVRAGWLSREWTAGPFGGIVDLNAMVQTKTSWIASRELDWAEDVVSQVISEKVGAYRYKSKKVGEGGRMFVNAIRLAFEGDFSKRSALTARWINDYHSKIHVDKVAALAASTFGTFTSSHQQLEIANCLKPYGFGVLTGGPGTGKTRVTCALLAFAAKISELQDCYVLACGPTGKSVARLRESFTSLFGSNTNSMPRFSTWHKALWNTELEGSELSRAAVIVGDEHSMHDIELMSRVFTAFPLSVFLFVGDDGQLPPVGAGHVLRDMIACKRIPVGRLTETHRNEGGIVDICQAILDKKPWKPHGNVMLHECATMQQAASEIENRIAAASLEGFHALRDVQVICAVNEKGDASKLALNRRLQSLFHGRNGAIAEYDESELSSDSGRPFRVGDKVVCRQNGMYEQEGSSTNPPGPHSKPNVSVCNGDQGIVEIMGPAGMVVELLSSPSRVVVPFNVPDAKSYHKNARCHWELAYAISCHSAQGSEWPLSFVVLDPSSAASGICNLEWLRTGISRGKIRTELFGSMETAKAFCKKSGRDRRKTLLAERINRKCEMLEMDL